MEINDVPYILENMSYGEVHESSSLAEEWLKTAKFGSLVHGSWITLEPGDAGVPIKDPCTGRILGNVKIATESDVNAAVTSSLGISKEWSNFPDRENILFKIASLVEKYSSLLAQVESLNRGVQLKDPRKFDVPTIANWFRYYAGWVCLAPSDLIGWKPYGVVAGITSVNTPLVALSWILAPAFMTGNCVCLVVPAELCLPAIALTQICVEAGLPTGVLNLLPGTRDTIMQLSSHTEINKITSFGTTEFVRELRESLKEFPSKKITAMMSGKSSMLVFDTADVDSAIYSAIKSAWYNQGLVPWALKTLLVQESIFPEFVTKLKGHLDQIRLGSAFDKMADLGKPYEREIVKNVAIIVEDARQNGIEVFQIELKEDQSPLDYFPPTVLIGGEATSNSVIKNDLLAPMITVVPFRTTKEALALANNTRYGFSASIWSENFALGMEAAEKLQAGTIWINSYGQMDPSVTISGWKESGNGSFGGQSGLYDYLQLKTSSSKLHLSSDVPINGLLPKEEENVKNTYQLFYGGSYKNADGNARQTIYIDSKPFASVAEANRKDVRNAVEVAFQAQAGWASTIPQQRGKVLYDMAAKVQSNKDMLARHIEMIKDASPISGLERVNGIVKSLKYWAASSEKYVFSNVLKFPCHTSLVSREPLGVIGIGYYEKESKHQLFEMLIWQMATSISYGNSIVIVLDSSQPTRFLELLKSCAGCVPPGVINVVTGNMQALMTTLADHQNVNAVFHNNFPDKILALLNSSACQNMKPVIRSDHEEKGERCRKEFSEYIFTRSKAVWISKGDIFAN